MKKAVFFTAIVSLTLASGVTYLYMNQQIDTLNEQLDFVEKHVQAQQVLVSSLNREKHRLETQLVAESAAQKELEASTAKATTVLKVLIKDAQANEAVWEKERTTWIKKQQQMNNDLNKLRQRIQDTDGLYAQRYELSKNLSQMNKQIVENMHLIKTTQHACDEFKKGNSWNWVSEKDCSENQNHQIESKRLMDKFNDLSQALNQVNEKLNLFQKDLVKAE